MEIYRKGQGMIARWVAASLLGIAAFFGCREIYAFLLLYPLPGEPKILDTVVTWGHAVATAVFIVCATGIWVVMNRPKVVDYLCETETEMQKVSWPARNELWGATGVVLVTLLLTAVFVTVVDFMIQFVMYDTILAHLR
ncbi:MAG: preprotein translocase subunit SecE [Planctomycetota bacterium]